MDLIAARTSPLPQIVWIELTSRCPFDCIFCTRAGLRGAGEHLDFALYERLIRELERPQVIRLNYAGESGHYPRLAEAVALAAKTAAQVELVSALASLKPERLEAALNAGLSRLTISLHTLDEQRFAQIYRFSSLASLLERLQQVQQWRQRAKAPFVLDLAFVAMQRNLDELPAIAAFAAAQDIGVLAVHPLIGRDPLPLGAASEHASGSLTAQFRAELAAALEQARHAAPGVRIQVSSYELGAPQPLSAQAQPWPWTLPAGGRVATCDQSPFDSVHVLADGSVVACEVTEKLSFGSLRSASLREIWHAPAYRAFRERHLAGSDAHCRSCVYKTAYRPGSAQPQLSGAHAPAAQLLRGWHADDGSGARWSGASAALWLARGSGRILHLRGLLATPAAGAEFRVRIDGEIHHQQRWSGPETVDLLLPLPRSRDPHCLIELECLRATSPSALGMGSDVRELGFALISAAITR